MGFTIDCNIVYQDAEGIYFNKIENHKIVGKVRPLEMGFKREETAQIYVFKEIQSAENLDNETVYFDMPLTFAFPEDEERKWRYCYFYKCKSGRIMLRDFESGVCSGVGINSELVKRGRAKKLPQDTLIPKNAPIYKINLNGELGRQLPESW